MKGLVKTQMDLGAVLRPGQLVGERYRVEQLLAEGGMAAVWAGTNERTGKHVALKVILPTFAEVGGAAELFRREALAASMVNHPSVVSIFDVIEHEGTTCIVMELLEGETLQAYLGEHGPLPVTEAVALLLPAMRGVAAANAKGVIHRDLKPGNLFLCKDPEGRLLTTKVLDFGISMLAERVVDFTSASGNPGARFGTPAYMAPEDIEFPHIVDSRTDVYGFGVLIFEVLTGQVPFPGEPSQELLARILTEPPPKVTSYRPDLPDAVQPILDRTLAKNPAERFPDVEHLIRAMEDHLLPPLPVQRSLSPIAGVAFLPRGPSNALPAALSQADEPSSPPGRARAGETRALYSLPADDSHVASGAGVISRLGLSQAVAIRARAWQMLRRGVLQRPIAAALIVAILLLIPWFLLFRGKDADGRGSPKEVRVEPGDPSARGPQVTPLPIPPPSRLPTIADVEEESGGSVRPPPAAYADHGGPPQPRAKAILRAAPGPRRSNPASRSGSHRAGTLSASDF